MKHQEIKRLGRMHTWRKVWNDFQREHGKQKGEIYRWRRGRFAGENKDQNCDEKSMI